MSVELLRPDGMLQQADYAPVAVATGSRLILLAGQAGVTPDFKPAAPDLVGQVHAALRNVIIGVHALFTPEFVVEIEARAVLD
ncbi:hypothetical protein [Micromonospora ureilytica]|uniref:hypothetical protein n=1 Tax=Micromonospora ureilytica TaxID=709868 RepID=UPI00403A08A8